MKTKNHSGIWCQKSRISAKWVIGFTLVLGSACSGQNGGGSDSTTQQTATPQETKLEDKLSEGQKNAPSTTTQSSSKPTKDEIVAFAKENGILSGSLNVANGAIKDLSDYKGTEKSCVYFAKGSSYVCADNGDLFVDATLAISEWGPHIRNVLPDPPPPPHIRNVLPSGAPNFSWAIDAVAKPIAGELSGRAQNDGWTKVTCAAAAGSIVTAISVGYSAAICATVGVGAPVCVAFLANSGTAITVATCAQLCTDKKLADCQ